MGQRKRHRKRPRQQSRILQPRQGSSFTISYRGINKRVPKEPSFMNLCRHGRSSLALRREQLCLDREPPRPPQHQSIPHPLFSLCWPPSRSLVYCFFPWACGSSMRSRRTCRNRQPSIHLDLLLSSEPLQSEARSPTTQSPRQARRFCLCASASHRTSPAVHHATGIKPPKPQTPT